GNYGAGYVIVWDRGTWKPLNDLTEGWESGKLLFELNGHKLRGRWTLIRLRESEKDWLLIKERDEYATKGVQPFGDESVLAGLILDDAVDPSLREKALLKPLKQRRLPALAGDRATLQPMLASSHGDGGTAFDRKGWLFEFKYDGYRLFAVKSA